MVLTRAQHAIDLLKSDDWPSVYDHALVRWLQYFCAPLDTLKSKGLFNMVLTQCRHFMARDFEKYITDLAVKKRVQTLKYDFYAFKWYINRPGVQFKGENGKVRVSHAYWDQFHHGRRVSLRSKR